MGEGQTLTIEAGTFVIAAQGSPTSLLVVRRGGQINANGTNVQPIIFTSENVWSDRISGRLGWPRRQRCGSDQPEQPDR